MVGTDVAARGIDVNDIDVVIQLACRYQDSFVHRSGRTARRGKEGLNILFIEPSEMSFALALEDKLNINIDVLRSIDAIRDQGDSDLSSD